VDRTALLLGLGFAAMIPVGQALFKLASLQHHAIEGPMLLRLASNPALIGALAWFGISALLWVRILAVAPLSRAYAFSILGSALVPLMAWALFGEPLSWTLAAGYLLILAGLALLVPSPSRAARTSA
jgi:drug/metabolite transporter (DMT)-like permease